jgi:DnaJ-domain-containing protein 1
MVLALAVLALAALAFYGRRAVGGWGQGRILILILAAAAAGGAVYEGLRGVWLGTLILIAAALWMGASARPAPTPSPSMSRSDAAATLGVSESASREEIEAAYRRLIRRVHPDQGGAPGLAAQLNAAREVMRRQR